MRNKASFWEILFPSSGDGEVSLEMYSHYTYLFMTCKLVIIIHTFLQEKLSENEFQKAENFTKMLRKNSGH